MARPGDPVLLVDENEDVREGLRAILEAEGWRVETALDGQDAINKLIGGLRPCIILYDLMSPLMNGVEFRREQSRYPALQRMPLVTYAGLKNVRQQAQRHAAGDRALSAELGQLLASVRQHCAL